MDRSLYFYGIFIGLLAWFFFADNGPPKKNAKWGKCYNEMYSRNYPKSSNVDEPTYILDNSVFIRSEVYDCRDEFVYWIYSKKSQSTLLNQETAKLLTRYIMCRDKGYTHEDCN